jgi:hypothetical protein
MAGLPGSGVLLIAGDATPMHRGRRQGLGVHAGPDVAAAETPGLPRDGAVSRQPRDRVTIDLRGIGPALHAQAAAQGKTVAAMVRVAVVTMLDAQVCSVAPARSAGSRNALAVKVTLRLDPLHAARLADRARSAEISQGAYVGTLLDGMPANPRATDHGDAIAALADSTQKVAAMSTDIHAFIRLIRNANGDGTQQYRAGLLSLSQDLRLHLQVASRLMAALRSRTRVPGSTMS